MNRMTKGSAAIVGLALLLVASPEVLAGGHIGGHRSIDRHGHKSFKGGHQGGGKTGTPKQTYQKVPGSKQHRFQLSTCIQLTERVRSQARSMEQTARDSGFSADLARQQWNQLRKEIRAMQQEHDRFINSLDYNQRAQMRGKIRKMSQASERVNSRLQGIDQELKQADTDPRRIARQARGIDKAMRKWHKQYVRTMRAWRLSPSPQGKKVVK